MQFYLVVFFYKFIASAVILNKEGKQIDSIFFVFSLRDKIYVFINCNLCFVIY